MVFTKNKQTQNHHILQQYQIKTKNIYVTPCVILKNKSLICCLYYLTKIKTSKTSFFFIYNHISIWMDVILIDGVNNR